MTAHFPAASANRLPVNHVISAPISAAPYRSPEHNGAVGGAKRSKHLIGAAFDIAMTNHDPVVFEVAAREVGFLGFGFYPRSGFMHVDLCPAREWGQKFLVRETAFAGELPHAREVLAESRTMKGGGAAGVATVGAAGVEVVQQAVADSQSVLQPLIPYLDSLRWLFISVALIGVSVTIYARWDDWRKPGGSTTASGAGRKRVTSLTGTTDVDVHEVLARILSIFD
jgi:zinc D-Ala-D-Ala carboxypeptidase